MEKETCREEGACGSCEQQAGCDEHAQHAHEEERLRETLSSIRRKIFVLSGKGGVGKSTVAVNLSVALAARGHDTGLLDIDIHGPNVAKMLGMDGRALSPDASGTKIEPFSPLPGLKAVSMSGLLPDSDTPVVWRGPMKMLAIRQFLSDVAWGALDYLIVDSPPGTGDEPLSIAQLIPDADGAVIITTPQEVALLDVRKSVNFAKRLKIPVLGIIENMSGLRCPHCSGSIPLFSQGGGEKAAVEMEVPFLGSLPISPEMSEFCDRGLPYVLQEEPDELIRSFETILGRLMEAVERKKA